MLSGAGLKSPCSFWMLGHTGGWGGTRPGGEQGGLESERNYTDIYIYKTNTKSYSTESLWLNEKSPTKDPGPHPSPSWDLGCHPLFSRLAGVLGREGCWGWNCIVRWGGWAWQGSPRVDTCTGSPSASLPLWTPPPAGPAYQRPRSWLDPVGLMTWRSYFPPPQASCPHVVKDPPQNA